MTGRQLEGIRYNEEKDSFELSDGTEVLGAVMILVCPPKDLRLPVLQYRSKVSDKVSTPLCATCADNETKKCTHNKR